MFKKDRSGDRSKDRSADRSKDWWRSEMKRRLSEIKTELTHDANSRIGAAVTEITSAHPGLWLAFSSTRTEPALPAIHTNISSSSATRYAFPCMTADPEAKNAASKMSFYVWAGTAATAVWTEHRFGIREPDLSHPSWSAVDVVRDAVRGALIPGLGFDRCLRRLGRGAGFYDRFLKDSKFLKVGVGFAVQLTDGLPHESHDVELDALVTDREVIWRMPSNLAPSARKADAS